MKKKVEVKIIVHLDIPISKRRLKGYIKDAVLGWKKGFDLEDPLRAIKKVTFKKPPANAKIGLSP